MAFLPFRENVVDVVWASEIFEHLQLTEFVRTLREIHRVSNKMVLATMPNPLWYAVPSARKRTPEHILRYSSFSLKCILKKLPRVTFRVIGSHLPLVHKDCRITELLLSKFPNIFITLIIMGQKRDETLPGGCGDNLQEQSTS